MSWRESWVGPGSSPGGPGRRRPAGRRLPHLGRAAGAGRREAHRVRAAADRKGRELRFGIRLHAITRATSEEAWADADRLLAGIDAQAIARAQAVLRSSQSEGQARMVALLEGRTDQLEVSPNLWAGVGLVRRRADRAGRQPRGGGRPDRRVPRPRHHRVHPLGLPPPRGGLPGRGRPTPRAARQGVARDDRSRRNAVLRRYQMASGLRPCATTGL